MLPKPVEANGIFITIQTPGGERKLYAKNEAEAEAVVKAINATDVSRIQPSSLTQHRIRATPMA